MVHHCNFIQLNVPTLKYTRSFPFIWHRIISSNRSHIVKLPKNKHIVSMGTPHQYVLLSAPPEKEDKFQQLKSTYGSVFAFHGSRVENWHSILRYNRAYCLVPLASQTKR